MEGKGEVADGAITPGPEPIEPDFTKWEAWRPEEVARRLVQVQAPWYIAVGWALDLFLGYERRKHEDLEIGAPQLRFGEIAAALAGFELFVVGGSCAWPLAYAGAAFMANHQTWVREPKTGLWRMDIFCEPSDRDGWVCRRDARIRLPYERPEVALLFKAKATRPKDDGDFSAVIPRLGPEPRRWLGEALALVHPGHRWLAEHK